jgi:4-diphosphocytidyl-2-C-methyl-D-erythritol kinase
LIVFPNCKINLGLNILNKRTDGYHNLETVFYPLPFHDVLEVIQSENKSKPYELFASGKTIQGNEEDNLCIKAYLLLKKDFPQLPAVKVYLHKVIPTGAGLGGGSSNGAFMLLLLNNKFNLKIPQEQLLNYALALGSDCPFFIINKTSFGHGRGEMIKPVELSLSGYKLLLVNPGIHISTAWAFSQVQFSNEKKISSIIHKPVEEWKDLTNDFEPVVFEKYPSIKTIKERMYNAGAIYASMSGTGSTVYGIFHGNTIIDQQILPQEYFIKELSL